MRIALHIAALLTCFMAGYYLHVYRTSMMISLDKREWRCIEWTGGNCEQYEKLYPRHLSS